MVLFEFLLFDIILFSNKVTCRLLPWALQANPLLWRWGQPAGSLRLPTTALPSSRAHTQRGESVRLAVHSTQAAA